MMVVAVAARGEVLSFWPMAVHFPVWPSPQLGETGGMPGLRLEELRTGMDPVAVEAGDIFLLLLHPHPPW